ncbi:hypothetical protein Taro_003487 [Colocasia esculenta]|uniref:Uncharacterized protein n=1 Tax=Colocasia esculenta TaxID=4460 RepID=A0A843TNP1_COLES|nr:hypothetical protein [Colocasia esculenta]
MAAKKVFEEFKPIFGEAMAERDSGPVAAPSALLRPFVFYVHALDPYRLEIAATDFCSHALERVLTVQDVEDLRDETGVGSSCSEFVDYLVASLSSDNVKLVVGGFTKLVAHKSKGMPRVSLSLNKLVGSSANDVMGNLSLALYRSFREKHGEVVKGCGIFLDENITFLLLRTTAVSTVGKVVALGKELHYVILQIIVVLGRTYFSPQEKTECLQKQLDSHSFKRKASRPKSSDKAVTVSELSNVEPLVNSEVQQPSEGPTDKDTSSMKASQRVVPAYRRAKVRGALLQDTDDNDDD